MKLQFPNTDLGIHSPVYWSSTTYAYSTDYAWVVPFVWGDIYGLPKSQSYYVRAVRGGQSSNASVDNGDGTVTDTSTGLMWQQDTARDGQGNYDPMTWEEALAYCESRTIGGHTDWRLPTIKELRSLVDHTKYDPAIDALHFPNTVASVYWSSTPFTYVTCLTWIIDFYNGGTGSGSETYYYVRAVRGGQSASFANLDHFVISNTSGGGAIPDQAVNTWFDVLIKAVDASGNTVTGFNGDVSLSAPGGIYPISARLGSGQGTVSVKLYSGGTTRINCSGYGAYGNSNYFSVSGGSACSGKIFGRVVDAKGSALYQADVKIYNAQGQLVTQKQTDASGNFSFSGLACGTYEIQALKNGKGRTISGIAVTSTMAQRLDDMQVPLNVGTGVIPVVYVPGMMGSSIGTRSPYPKLPLDLPARGLHIHLDDYTGYKKLKKALEDTKEFKVFPCPWDWRQNFKEAYRCYLMPKITEALQECGSTTGKVYIVAHSMGGLVARAYIQSEDYAERQNVKKLAMVGTPHLGSCNPYYIWEGGDPKGVDDIVDERPSRYVNPTAFVNAYSNTLQNLWEETYDKKGWRNGKHDEIREFVRGKAGSLLELMHTGKFLSDLTQQWAIETSGNVNSRLNELNDGTGGYAAPSDVMSKTGDAGTKVEARLFVGNRDTSTIRWVRTLQKSGPYSTNSRYEDGIPRNETPIRKNVIWGRGDGTVPYDSATWPNQAGWAEMCGYQSENPHMALVKDFSTKIVEFLEEGEATSVRTPEDRLEAQDADESAAQLSVFVLGDMRTAFRDGSARQTGIDPSTGIPVEQIPNSGCAFGAEGGWVGIEGPSAGTYQVIYFGEAQRDFHLDIGWVDDSITENYSFRGFRPSAARTFSVAVNPTGTPRLTITPPAKAPTNLQANPYTSGTEKTRLTWAATGEAGLTGYNIYAVAELEPYFTKVTTVGAGTTTYDTADAWSSSSATTVKTYAVAAVKTGGIESFFSNLAQNNDRDHDGLTDEEEVDLGTDKTKADTDGDGLKDGDEQAYNTNPLVKDTDGDGYNDNTEIQAGTDPLDPASVPPATRYVEPAGACGIKTPCYKTIQAALNAATDGDTIQAAKTLTPEAPVWSKTGTVTISGGWKTDFSVKDGTTSMYAPKATGGGGVKVQPSVKIIPKP